MENKLKKGLYNTKYVLTSQFFTFALGVVRSLIIPIAFSKIDYSYWQLYLFYITYIGVLTLGYNDGFYLRYGKTIQINEDKLKISSSIIFFFMATLIIVLLFLLILIFNINSSRNFIYIFTILNLFFVSVVGFFYYYLQISNKMKRFSIFLSLEKILTFILLMLSVLFLIMILNI